MNNQEGSQTVQVTPEDLVIDYLIGEHELQKLKYGFQAPTVAGQPCEPSADFAEPADH